MKRALILSTFLLGACAPAPTEVIDCSANGVELPQVVRGPLKVLIALDGTDTMAASDPTGSRGAAVSALLNALPQTPEVSVAVLVFTGNTLAWLAEAGKPGFVPVTAVDSAQRTTIASRIAGFQNPTPTSGPDFVRTLVNIRSALEADLASLHSQDPAALAPRYEIILVSNGGPAQNQDQDLFCGDAISGLLALTSAGAQVHLNTVHVAGPTPNAAACDPNEVRAPATQCLLATWPAGTCDARRLAVDAARLQQMADLGSGEFRDVLGGTAVDLGFSFVP